MCGIAGILGVSSGVAQCSVDKMLGALSHRGPDGQGKWAAPGADLVFGHTRLSIIDLSDAGNQPMVDHEANVTLVYNGECYNYVELRNELTSLGHSFHSDCDTEVVLRAYIEWGEDAIAKLRGMFALAIWDHKLRKTLLARDSVGIKPLYYYHRGEEFIFASELRAILAAERIPKKINPTAVASYLWHGFVPGPETIVAGVCRMDPGTIMQIDEHGKIVSIHRYSPQVAESLHDVAAKDRAGLIADEVRRSVNEHLVSDVPIGIFLSGGVDSSVVALVAAEQSKSAVKTFNVSFSESEYDESHYATEVAKLIGTEHTQLNLTEQMFHDNLERALDCIDQPTFDALNTFFVSKLVRDSGVVVALAGTGGDELFGGYSSFGMLQKTQQLAFLSKLPAGIRNIIGRSVRRMVSDSNSEIPSQVRWGKAADMLASCGDLINSYQVAYAMFESDFYAELLGRQPTHTNWGLSDRARARIQDRLDTSGGILGQISEIELMSFLGERLLPDSDMASMAVSLELRVPLLDHQLIAASKQLSPADRFLPLQEKKQLRSIVAGRLGKGLFDRPKAGFELPLNRWCRDRLSGDMEATFTDAELIQSVGLNKDAVGKLWRSFKSGSKGLYWSRVWSIFVLLEWARRHGVTV